MGDYGFLSFANMDDGTFGRLSSLAEIGLGWRLAVALKSQLAFENKRIYRHTYDLEMTSSVIDEFRLSVSYHRVYYRSVHEEPEVQVRLQCLL